ncbi:MAG TPA: hypothetical protein VIT22_13450 [Pseudoxanthomonas sp.]
MATLNFSRWLAPVVLAAGLGMVAMTPAAARADDNLVRVLVDVADVIYHSGQPYYRYGDYGRYDRVVIVRDRYRRPTYYRYVPRDYRMAYGPPYGRAHGYYRHAPRYDYRYRDHRYSRHDRRDRWDDDDDWDNDRRDRRRGRGHDRDDD